MSVPVSPPSITSLDALISQLLPGSMVAGIELLPGSFSNSTFRVDIMKPGGIPDKLVARCYAFFGGYDRGEKARREFLTLQLLGEHNIPAPRGLYLDQTGKYLGAPGILTSFVEGTHDLSPANPSAWVVEMAQVLSRIHSIPLPVQNYLLDGNAEVVWFINGTEPPAEIRDHPLGGFLCQNLRQRLPYMRPVAPALVHIDYWLGNLLWQDGHISAVLDWEEASYGDPAYDVAYLRACLFLLGMPEAAREFLLAYQHMTGNPVSNLGIWELAAAARYMPAEDVVEEFQALAAVCTNEIARQGLEQFIIQAME